MSQFKRFYTTDISVIKITQTGAYSRTETVTELCTTKADVQPYNGGLAQKEYGLSIECQKRIYCDCNENIVAGNYIDVKGERYRIVYVENWELGAMAILEYCGVV